MLYVINILLYVINIAGKFVFLYRDKEKSLAWRMTSEMKLL